MDTLRLRPSASPRDWHEAQLTTWWIPDAFIGPMASLMEAIQTGDEPLTSGATIWARCEPSLRLTARLKRAARCSLDEIAAVGRRENGGGPLGNG